MVKHYKCLIVDDHPIVRKGIRDLVLCEGVCSKVFEAEDAAGALSAIGREPWDLVILDVSLPDKHGLEVLKEIKLLQPKATVLMLSLYPEKEFALRALKAGASGYLTKDRAPSELLKAVKELLAGRRYITQSLGDLMVTFLDEGQPAAPHSLLSDREIEVLRLLGQGKPVSVIAADMALSGKTISTYRSRLLEKLRLRTTAELMRYAIESNLTD
ncbi:MAG: response regulator transcription factor [Nitrospirota bacterium]|nr:response regulator transcription factor [Nitrospirota bacterium]